jgi:hypothetical protein
MAHFAPENRTLRGAVMSAGRVAMYNENALKLGLFGANCSSGRYVTKVPERWSGSWDDNALLAQMADRAGIDFLLPIGRWKGYGGDTDYQGATWETLTGRPRYSPRPSGLPSSGRSTRRSSTR